MADIFDLGDFEDYQSEISSNLAGIQVPTIDRYTESGRSFDAVAGAVSEAFLGRTFLPWQQHVSRVWMMVHPDTGRFIHYKVGLSVPRQNGKSALLISTALTEAAVMGRKVLYTAHQTKTSDEAFIEICQAVEQMEDGEVLQVRKANGQQVIRFASGGQIKVIARTKSSGRGLTFDTVICDEAQEMSDAEEAALSAVVSAAPSGDGRLIFVGTPPEPGAGDPFRALRSEVLGKARSPRSAWLEWGAERGDIDTDDEDLWARYNPSLGIGALTVSALREEASSPTFIVERLGCWQAAESNMVITLETWRSLRATSVDINPQYDTSKGVSLGIDISPDAHSASVVACGTWTDPETGQDHPMVSVLDHRAEVAASDWVPSYVARVSARLGANLTSVVIDKASPVADKIAAKLSRMRVKVTLLGYGQAKSAFAGLMEHVFTGELRHMQQPTLDSALVIARRRKSGDAFLWKKLSGAEGDITPVVAMTHAVYGWEEHSINRKRKRAYRGINFK